MAQWDDDVAYPPVSSLQATDKFLFSRGGQQYGADASLLGNASQVEGELALRGSGWVLTAGTSVTTSTTPGVFTKMIFVGVSAAETAEGSRGSIDEANSQLLLNTGLWEGEYEMDFAYADADAAVSPPDSGLTVTQGFTLMLNGSEGDQMTQSGLFVRIPPTDLVAGIGANTYAAIGRAHGKATFRVTTDSSTLDLRVSSFNNPITQGLPGPLDPVQSCTVVAVSNCVLRARYLGP